jgi:hypothetical protein
MFGYIDITESKKRSSDVWLIAPEHSVYAEIYIFIYKIN